MVMNYSERQQQVMATLAAEGIEGLVVVSPANVRYLTGFAGEGVLLLDEKPCIVTDGRYQEEGKRAKAELVIAQNGALAGLCQLLGERKPGRVGFEADHTTVTWAERMRTAVEEAELVPTSSVVEKLRACKDDEELALIRRAAAIADMALADFLASDFEGMTERRVALAIHGALLDLGAEGPAFDIIVAFGEGAAEPHHANTDKVISGPGVLLLDIGATVEGYRSDLTRTVFLGPPDDTFRRLYRAAWEAQRRSLSVLRAGVSSREVDNAARSFLADEGLAEYFSHGLGHGVGLEIHEAPTLGPTRDDTLQAGQVVTVEPGLYLPGWGGVRIEDLVIVREDGAEVVSAAPKLAPDAL
ncbi:MAG: Xaa-Pro peptidase family protein [Armatimonadetes bacterium]|nr:Xaa-Pro peptidase family protein [Armatimonadota bacterium]